MVDVVVIGGGAAGLATAFWYRRADPACDVRVFEAGARPGGHVRTDVRDGYTLEWGPQAIRTDAGFDEFAAAAGIADQQVFADANAKTRWLGRRGVLHRMPGGPLGLLRSRVLSFGDKVRALREPWVERSEVAGETVAAFVARRFGDGVVPLVQAFVSGVFAGDADELEVAAAFPALASAERDHGSVIRGLRRRRAGPMRLSSFSGGMEDVVRALHEHQQVTCGRAARGVERVRDEWSVRFDDGSSVVAPELVLAVPADVAARLLAGVDPQLEDALRGIPTAPVVNVYLGCARDEGQSRQRGFGFLLEPGERTAVLGAIYASELFPDHAPAGRSLYRVMLGGARASNVLEFDDAVLRDAAVSALREYALVRGAIEFEHVVRIADAIPQYVRGHSERMVRIESRLHELPGLSLRGNSYRGVALTSQFARVERAGRVQGVAT